MPFQASGETWPLHVGAKPSLGGRSRGVPTQARSSPFRWLPSCARTCTLHCKSQRSWSTSFTSSRTRDNRPATSASEGLGKASSEPLWRPSFGRLTSDDACDAAVAHPDVRSDAYSWRRGGVSDRAEVPLPHLPRVLVTWTGGIDLLLLGFKHRSGCSRTAHIGAEVALVSPHRCVMADGRGANRRRGWLVTLTLSVRTRQKRSVYAVITPSSTIAGQHRRGQYIFRFGESEQRFIPPPPVSPAPTSLGPKSRRCAGGGSPSLGVGPARQLGCMNAAHLPAHATATFCRAEGYPPCRGRRDKPDPMHY